MAKKPTQADINAKIFESLNSLAEKIEQLGSSAKQATSSTVELAKTSKKRGRPKKTQTEEEFNNPIKTLSTVVKKGRRPNEFLKMLEDPSFVKSKDFQDTEKDKKIDKKLKGRISARIREPAKLIEAVCNRCGKKNQVSPVLVRHEDGQIKYVCNGCIGGK